MTVTARKYNPGFLSDDELVASFCVRTEEFDSMIEPLRECSGKSSTHQIVIGPRGSGKTSLLLRIAAEIRRDGRLSSRFFPVVFAEESYEVSTAGEFWLECLSRLADQAPRGEDGPRSASEFRGSAANPGRPDARGSLSRRHSGFLRPGRQAPRADRRKPEHAVPGHRRRRCGIAATPHASDRAPDSPSGQRDQPVRRDRQSGSCPLRPVPGANSASSRYRRLRDPVAGGFRAAAGAANDPGLANPDRRQPAGCSLSWPASGLSCRFVS